MFERLISTRFYEEPIYVLDVQREDGRLGSMDKIIEKTYPVRLTPGEWFIFDDFDVNLESLNRHPSLQFGVKVTTRKKPFQVQISDSDVWKED